ncbi:MAG TPA: peroxiredoxin [Gemmataceae bacterium]|nr:peroxiredoxin [Gemmataceae bacterium]
MTTVRRWVVLPLVLAFLALAACIGPLSADDEYQKIIYWRVGDPAVPIQLKDDQGGVWDSKQHYGKKYVVLYFYEGDFMPKCTQEAVAFRDACGAITSEGAELIGISGDETANHQRFKEKYHLQQTLLADDKGDVGKAFGLAWSGGGDWPIVDAKGKEIKLHRGITESRWTWIVGKDGAFIYKNMNVDPEQNAKEVLKFLNDRNNPKEP